MRFIRPTSRSSGLSATSTGTTTWSPAAVSIVTAGPVSSGSVVVVASGALEVPAEPETVVVGGLDSSSPHAEAPSSAARQTSAVSKRTTLILPAQDERAPKDPLVLVRPCLGRGRAAHAARGARRGVRDAGETECGDRADESVGPVEVAAGAGGRDRDLAACGLASWIGSVSRIWVAKLP